jgi:hypothetical protein
MSRLEPQQINNRDLHLNHFDHHMFIIFQFFPLKFYESRAIQQRIREVLHPIETPMPAVLKSHQATWRRGPLGSKGVSWDTMPADEA